MALLKGTLDPLVLKTLSWTPMHAFEITTWIEERSAGRVAVDDAALLQALHRMEARRLIVAEWGVTKNGRRARYYGSRRPDARTCVPSPRGSSITSTRRPILGAKTAK